MFTRTFHKSYDNITSLRDPPHIDSIKRRYTKPLYHHRSNSDRWASEQILTLEKISLEEELNVQKVANKKSMKIIEELISENKKYRQSLHTSSGTKIDKNQPWISKKTEKPFLQAFQTKPVLKVRETEASEQANEKTEEKVPISKELNQLNSTKNAIFKKLYEDKKANHQIVKNMADKNNEEMLLKEEIKYLKDQLHEKNKNIVDLQCQLLKHRKQAELTTKVFKDDVAKTRIRDFSINKQVHICFHHKRQHDHKETQTQEIVHKKDQNIQKIQPISIYQEKVTERQSQRPSVERQERQSQTSENFYAYIEETYLEWFFQKEFQNMKKSK